MEWSPRLTIEPPDEGFRLYFAESQIRETGDVTYKYSFVTAYRDLYNYVVQTDDSENASVGVGPPVSCYEVIHGKQKPYFDLDIDTASLAEDVTEYDILRDLLTSIDVIRRFDDVSVYSSHGKKKKSFHVVCQDVYVNGHLEAKQFASRVVARMEPENRSFVDMKVYTKVRLFRTLFSRKYGSFRQKILDPQISQVVRSDYKNFKRSLVTYVDASSLMDVAIPLAQNYQAADIDDLTPEEMERIEEALFDEFGLSVSISGVKGTIISLKNEGGYWCRQCDRTHENENPYLLVRRIETSRFDSHHYHHPPQLSVRMNCRRSDEYFTLMGLGTHIMETECQIAPDSDVESVESRRDVESDETQNNAETKKRRQSPIKRDKADGSSIDKQIDTPIARLLAHKIDHTVESHTRYMRFIEKIM